MFFPQLMATVPGRSSLSAPYDLSAQVRIAAGRSLAAGVLERQGVHCGPRLP